MDLQTKNPEKTVSPEANDSPGALYAKCYGRGVQDHKFLVRTHGNARKMMLHVTAKNFEIEVKQCTDPVVVMFYADWCPKCAMMKGVVEQLEKKYRSRIKFCGVEIEESSALANEYGAEIVPTFVTFKNREVDGVMRGLLNEQIFEERIRELLE